MDTNQDSINRYRVTTRYARRNFFDEQTEIHETIWMPKHARDLTLDTVDSFRGTGNPRTTAKGHALTIDATDDYDARATALTEIIQYGYYPVEIKAEQIKTATEIEDTRSEIAERIAKIRADRKKA